MPQPAFNPYAYAASQAAAEQSATASPSAASAAPAAPFNPYLYAQASQQAAQQKQSQNQYDPASGPGVLDLGVTTVPVPNWLETGLEGVGKAFTDIGRGAGERLGFISPQQITADRALDAPLMSTTSGKVGDIAGNVAVTAPAMLIPGVNTVAGGVALGGLLGGLQPTAPGESALKNTLVGAASGGIGTGVGNRVADLAGGMLASRAAAAERASSLNAERDAVLTAGREAGYKVPPTAINPNLVNTAAESVSGKAATRQAMQATNATVTNKLTAGDLRLPKDQPITLSAIKSVRADHGGAYDAVKNTGSFQSDDGYYSDLQRVLANTAQMDKAYPGMAALGNPKIQDLVKAASVNTHDASSAVDFTKYLRNQAAANFKSAFRTGDPQTLDLAHAQQGVADAVEDLIGRHLDNIGKPELAQQWQDARTIIAKSYQAQAALKGNNIDALRLARQLNSGKPMTGGMGLVAKFATHFGDVSGLPKSGPGVSKLAFMMGVGGEGAASFLHSPGLAAAGVGAMAAPYAARKVITSGLGQSLLATPRYPSLASILGNQVLRGIGTAGHAGVLSAPIALITTQP